MANKIKRQPQHLVLYYGPRIDLPEYRPKPTYDNDEQYLHRILPAEIWSMVIAHLNKDCDAVQSSGNSSLYFRQLQENHLVKHLFPKVIEVLIVRNERKKYKVYTPSEIEIIDGDGWCSYRMFRKSIQSCRLVCSAWNKGVEIAYQSLLQKELTELEQGSDQFPIYNPISIDWVKESFEKYHRKGPENFLQRFEASHSTGISAHRKNPFMGRHLAIDFDDAYFEESDLAYYKAVFKVLTLFGHNLWYCRIDMPDDCEKRVKIYKKLRKWLTFMPNLKYLHVNGFRNGGHIKPKIFEQFAIPKFEYLKEMKLTRVAGPLASELILKNNHVQNLYLCFVVGIFDKAIKSLSNLNAFGSFSAAAGEYMIEDFGSDWNLGQLSISQMDAGMIPGASKYFEILRNNWSGSLTNLKIRSPFTDAWTDIMKLSRSLRLDLPLVSRLSITIKDDFFLDFILPMKNSLNYLEINSPDPKHSFDISRNQVMKEQTIQFIGYEEKMQESNIWKIFSKLKTIKLICGGNSSRYSLDWFLVYTKDTKRYFEENK